MTAYNRVKGTSPLKLSSEDQLILLLAGGKLSTCTREQACALMAKSLDWDVILERVMAEEVYPVFYRNLNAMRREQGAASSQPEIGDQRSEVFSQRLEIVGPSSSVAGQRSAVSGPQSFLEQLGRLTKINAFRNALLTEELVRVLTLFDDVGIRTIPLKGVTLAESQYGDTAARVCSDIDILVPRSSVENAFRHLLDAGFDAYDQEVDSSEIDRLLDSNIEYSFVRRSEGMTFLLELHWDIAWRWGKNGSVIDDLWVEAQPKTYWGVYGYALSPEWELLYLAVHAAHHQWQGLKWLVDIHEMSAGREIDWDKLKMKAKQLGLERTLALTLSACHKLFGTLIPAGLLISPLPDWMNVFPDVATPTDVWKNNFFPARLFKRPSEKLGYLARIAFIPTLNEQRLLPLPWFLTFLYYPLRPLRLVCKWGWALLARSRERRAGSMERGVGDAQRATGA